MTISQRPATLDNEGLVGIANAAPASNGPHTVLPGQRLALMDEVR